MARSMLLFGESGTFKTSNCGEFASFLYERYGQPVRLITADSGFSPVRRYVDQGIIKPWNIKASTMPLACIMLAAKGAWPVSINDDGIADESMNPFMSYPAGDLKDECSGIIVEGLYMIARLIHRYLLSTQRSTGEPLMSLFEEMGVKFAGASRGTYGFIQEFTSQYVSRFSELDIPWFLMTGHEDKGEDETTKRAVFGPVITGKKLVDKIPGWFENTFHMDKYSYQLTTAKSKKQITRNGVRMFITSHQDAEIPTIFWPAKLGVPPDVAEQLLTTYEDGYVPMIYKDGVYSSSVRSVMEIIDPMPMEGEQAAR